MDFDNDDPLRSFLQQTGWSCSDLLQRLEKLKEISETKTTTDSSVTTENADSMNGPVNVTARPSTHVVMTSTTRTNSDMGSIQSVFTKISKNSELNDSVNSSSSSIALAMSSDQSDSSYEKCPPAKNINLCPNSCFNKHTEDNATQSVKSVKLNNGTLRSLNNAESHDNDDVCSTSTQVKLRKIAVTDEVSKMVNAIPCDNEISKTCATNATSSLSTTVLTNAVTGSKDLPLDKNPKDCYIDLTSPERPTHETDSSDEKLIPKQNSLKAPYLIDLTSPVKAIGNRRNSFVDLSSPERPKISEGAKESIKSSATNAELDEKLMCDKTDEKLSSEALQICDSTVPSDLLTKENLIVIDITTDINDSLPDKIQTSDANDNVILVDSVTNSIIDALSNQESDKNTTNGDLSFSGKIQIDSISKTPTLENLLIDKKSDSLSTTDIIISSVPNSPSNSKINKANVTTSDVIISRTLNDKIESFELPKEMLIAPGDETRCPIRKENNELLLNEDSSTSDLIVSIAGESSMDETENSSSLDKKIKNFLELHKTSTIPDVVVSKTTFSLEQSTDNFKSNEDWMPAELLVSISTSASFLNQKTLITTADFDIHRSFNENPKAYLLSDELGTSEIIISPAVDPPINNKAESSSSVNNFDAPNVIINVTTENTLNQISENTLSMNQTPEATNIRISDFSKKLKNCEKSVTSPNEIVATETPLVAVSKNCSSLTPIAEIKREVCAKLDNCLAEKLMDLRNKRTQTVDTTIKPAVCEKLENCLDEKLVSSTNEIVATETPLGSISRNGLSTPTVVAEIKQEVCEKLENCSIEKLTDLPNKIIVGDLTKNDSSLTPIVDTEIKREICVKLENSLDEKLANSPNKIIATETPLDTISKAGASLTPILDVKIKREVCVKLENRSSEKLADSPNKIIATEVPLCAISQTGASLTPIVDAEIKREVCVKLENRFGEKLTDSPNKIIATEAPLGVISQTDASLTPILDVQIKQELCEKLENCLGEKLTDSPNKIIATKSLLGGISKNDSPIVNSKIKQEVCEKLGEKLVSSPNEILTAVTPLDEISKNGSSSTTIVVAEIKQEVCEKLGEKLVSSRNEIATAETPLGEISKNGSSSTTIVVAEIEQEVCEKLGKKLVFSPNEIVTAETPLGEISKNGSLSTPIVVAEIKQEVCEKLSNCLEERLMDLPNKIIGTQTPLGDLSKNDSSLTPIVDAEIKQDFGVKLENCLVEKLAGSPNKVIEAETPLGVISKNGSSVTPIADAEIKQEEKLMVLPIVDTKIKQEVCKELENCLVEKLADSSNIIATETVLGEMSKSISSLTTIVDAEIKKGFCDRLENCEGEKLVNSPNKIVATETSLGGSSLTQTVDSEITEKCDKKLENCEGEKLVTSPNELLEVANEITVTETHLDEISTQTVDAEIKEKFDEKLENCSSEKLVALPNEIIEASDETIAKEAQLREISANCSVLTKTVDAEIKEKFWKQLEDLLTEHSATSDVGIKLKDGSEVSESSDLSPKTNQTLDGIAYKVLSDSESNEASQISKIPLLTEISETEVKSISFDPIIAIDERSFNSGMLLHTPVLNSEAEINDFVYENATDLLPTDMITVTVISSEIAENETDDNISDLSEKLQAQTQPIRRRIPRVHKADIKRLQEKIKFDKSKQIQDSKRKLLNKYKKRKRKPLHSKSFKKTVPKSFTEKVRNEIKAQLELLRNRKKLKTVSNIDGQTERMENESSSVSNIDGQTEKLENWSSSVSDIDGQTEKLENWSSSVSDVDGQTEQLENWSSSVSEVDGQTQKLENWSSSVSNVDGQTEKLENWSSSVSNVDGQTEKLENWCSSVSNVDEQTEKLEHGSNSVSNIDGQAEKLEHGSSRVSNIDEQTKKLENGSSSVSNIDGQRKKLENGSSSLEFERAPFTTNDALISNDSSILIVEVMGGYVTPPEHIEVEEEEIQDEIGYVNPPECMEVKIEEPDDDCIKLTKTDDITKIKGWKYKKFNVALKLEPEFDDSTDVVILEEPEAHCSTSNTVYLLPADLFGPEPIKSDIEDTYIATLPNKKKNRDMNFTVEKGNVFHDKISTQSAFVSDALDEYLTGNSKLNISYEVPALMAEKSLNGNYNEISVIPKPASSFPNSVKPTKTEDSYKPKTLAEKRMLLIKNDSTGKENAIRDFVIPPVTGHPKKYEEQIRKVQNKLLEDNIPFTKRCFKHSLKVTKHYNYVVYNGKKLRIPAKGHKQVVANISEKNFSADEEQRQVQPKAKPSLLQELREHQKSIYKPGPLSKKNELQTLESFDKWTTVIKKLPLVYLEVRPKLKRRIHPSIAHFLQHDGLSLKETDVRFALSVLRTDKCKYDKTFHRFPLKYANNQQNIVIRKEAIIPRPVMSPPTPEKVPEVLESDIPSVVKNMLNKMLDSVEISLMDESVYTIDESNVNPEVAVAIRPISPINPMIGTIIKRPAKRVDRTALELRRLNVRVIEVNLHESSESEVCYKDHCKLGCVCKSLKNSTVTDHCSRVDCMFKCVCSFDNKKQRDQQVTLPVGTDLLSAGTVDRLQNEAKKDLAKVEKDFIQTVIKANNETILVGNCLGERQKRITKAPKKYYDFVEHAPEHEVAPETDWKAIIPLKLCTVPLTKLDLGAIVPYCLTHELYKCYCKLQSDYAPGSAAINLVQNQKIPRLKYESLDVTKHTARTRGIPTNYYVQRNSLSAYNAKLKKLHAPRRHAKLHSSSTDEIRADCDVTVDDTPVAQKPNKRKQSLKTREDFDHYGKRMKFSPDGSKAVEPAMQRRKSKNNPNFIAQGVVNTGNPDEKPESFKMVKKLMKSSDSKKELFVPTNDLKKEFLQLLGKSEDTNHQFRLLPWPVLAQKYASGALQLWYCDNSTKILVTEDGVRPSKNYFNIKFFESTADPTNIDIDIIRWLITKTTPKNKNDTDTMVILSFKRLHWEICGLCEKNVIQNRISENMFMKLQSNVSISDSKILPGKPTTSVTSPAQNSTESPSTIKTKKVISYRKRGFKLKTLYSDELNLELNLAENKESETHGQIRIKNTQVITAQLPEITEKCKWRMLRLNSNFSYLTLKRNGYSIKYTDLIVAVKMARSKKVTITLKSVDIDSKYPHSDFGIYCEPSGDDRIFIGPYYRHESDDLETLRYGNGVLINTDLFNQMKGKPNIQSGTWFYQGLADVTAPKTNQSVIDLTDVDSDNEQGKPANFKILANQVVKTATHQQSLLKKNIDQSHTSAVNEEIINTETILKGVSKSMEMIKESMHNSGLSPPYPPTRLQPLSRLKRKFTENKKPVVGDKPEPKKPFATVDKDVSITELEEGSCPKKQKLDDDDGVEIEYVNVLNTTKHKCYLVTNVHNLGVVVAYQFEGSEIVDIRCPFKNKYRRFSKLENAIAVLEKELTDSVIVAPSSFRLKVTLAQEIDDSIQTFPLSLTYLQKSYVVGEFGALNILNANPILLTRFGLCGDEMLHVMSLRSEMILKAQVCRLADSFMSKEEIRTTGNNEIILNKAIKVIEKEVEKGAKFSEELAQLEQKKLKLLAQYNNLVGKLPKDSPLREQALATLKIILKFYPKDKEPEKSNIPSSPVINPKRISEGEISIEIMDSDNEEDDSSKKILKPGEPKEMIISRHVQKSEPTKHNGNLQSNANRTVLKKFLPKVTGEMEISLVQNNEAPREPVQKVPPALVDKSNLQRTFKTVRVPLLGTPSKSPTFVTLAQVGQASVPALYKIKQSIKPKTNKPSTSVLLTAPSNSLLISNSSSTKKLPVHTTTAHYKPTPTAYLAPNPHQPPLAGHSNPKFEFVRKTVSVVAEDKTVKYIPVKLKLQSGPKPLQQIQKIGSHDVKKYLAVTQARSILPKNVTSKSLT